MRWKAKLGFGSLTAALNTAPPNSSPSADGTVGDVAPYPAYPEGLVQKTPFLRSRALLPPAYFFPCPSSSLPSADRSTVWRLVGDPIQSLYFQMKQVQRGEGPDPISPAVQP